MELHAKIVSALKGGDAATALAEIGPLLGSAAENADLVGLKALALVMSGRIGEGADCARLAVRLAADPAQRLKHAGNLARLLANAGRYHELANLPQLDLPRPGAVAEGSLDFAVLENLCAPLLAVGQTDFVAAYLDEAIDRPSATWAIERLWLRAATAAGWHERLRCRVIAPGYRWSEESEALALACAAALAEGRPEEAEKLYSQFLSAAPAYVSARRDTQLLSIAIISPIPSLDSLSLSRVNQHFTANFPSQIAMGLGDRYRFASVFVGSPPSQPQWEAGASVYAVTINNCVNGEDLKRGQLAAVQAHEAALGLPVINAASQALQCTRGGSANLLHGVPNLIVPKVLRFRLETGLIEALSRSISQSFRLPVILRTVGEQEGRNIHLAANAGELRSVLSSFVALEAKDFYAIEYCAVEHGVGLYRRIRAAFVKGQPILMRADYDTQWMVKGRKTERIQSRYRSEPSLRERADALLRDPHSVGQAAWDALRHIGQRMPLDVFGLDFDVDHQGRVVFFEANATMNLLSTAPAEIDYPREGDDAFLSQLDALLRERAGIAIQ